MFRFPDIFSRMEENTEKRYTFTFKRNDMEKGYLHIYTGNGKGKTTAAFGLALRAVCAGKNVYIGQFIKSMKYHENRLTELLEQAGPSFGKLTIELLGRGCFLTQKPQQEDIEMAQKALQHCAELLKGQAYDVIILDELCVALYFHLLTVQEVLQALQNRNPAIEVVMTGRKAPQELIDVADLVTEMQEVKHYYQQGVLSRDGIDR